jgi:predicted aspartyl protease
MPHLTITLRAEGRDKSGNTVSVPPHIALANRGPVVQASIAVADQVAKSIVAEGGTLPDPQTGWALIDTGASSTCVDDEVAQALGLPAVDVVRIASASHSASEQNVYPIRLEIAGLPVSLNAPRAIGAPLKAQGLVALIGRDVLAACTLFYNGPNGQLTISI